MKDEEMDSRMRVLRVGCCDETSRPKAGIKSVQRKGRKGTQRGAKTCEFAESRVLSAAFPGHCAPSTCRIFPSTAHRALSTCRSSSFRLHPSSLLFRLSPFVTLAELQLQKAIPVVPRKRPRDNRSKPATGGHRGGVVKTGWPLGQRRRISHDPLQSQP